MTVAHRAQACPETVQAWHTAPPRSHPLCPQLQPAKAPCQNPAHSSEASLLGRLSGRVSKRMVFKTQANAWESRRTVRSSEHCFWR
jgi:hypothetical protein